MNFIQVLHKVGGGEYDIEVTENYISINGTVIALNKINAINAQTVSQKFPMWSLALIVVSFFLFSTSSFFGLLALVIGGFWIYYWYQHRLIVHIGFDTSAMRNYDLFVANVDLDKAIELRQKLMQQF
ncbi:DUF6232 family protein [Paucilactobacillus kaifaensis]|uniref:DUF6232 family protein n=1 Tax=Paucilactobacillus kaifaensis TaxID=2559921 RepID=UPI0010F8A8B5|nr:DUF6232 family protein [Paucilactobacillus kaifaensis]